MQGITPQRNLTCGGVEVREELRLSVSSGRLRRQWTPTNVRAVVQPAEFPKSKEREGEQGLIGEGDSGIGHLAGEPKSRRPKRKRKKDARISSGVVLSKLCVWHVL